MPQRFTTETFIQRALAVHGGKYDYSLVDYRNNRTEVLLACRIHGEFSQVPQSHLEGREGCPLCQNHRPWSDAEAEYVKSHAGQIPIEDIASHLGRTTKAVNFRAARVLKVSAAFHNQVQPPGRYRKFHCGCEGVFPERGVSNKFVCWCSKAWACRVSRVLRGGANAARKLGYQPIDPNIPHSDIRRLMDDPNCERCGAPLIWEFGQGKTPHLHHNHESGKIYGFTHPHCNPRALEIEIDRLQEQVCALRANQFLESIFEVEYEHPVEHLIAA